MHASYTARFLFYISDDGHTIILGKDFNEGIPNKSDKLEVLSDDNSGKITTKSYLANSQLLRSKNVAIIDVDYKSMTVVDTASNNLFYQFDLSNTEYSRSSLTPLSETEEIKPYPSYNLYGATYLYEDNDYYYFAKRETVENAIIAVNKKTKETFVPSKYSALAKFNIYKNNLYVVDSVK